MTGPMTILLVALAVVRGPDGVAAQSPQAAVGQVQRVSQDANSSVGSPPDEAPTLAAREALQQALNAQAAGDQRVLRFRLRKLPPSHARVIQLVEGFHLWRFLGDTDRQVEAQRAALEGASALGTDPSSALSAPIPYRWGNAVAPRPHPDGRQIMFRTGGGLSRLGSSNGPLRLIRMRPSPGQDDLARGARPLVSGTRRVATDTTDWWPAYQTAYLDLGYRWLPNLIAGRLEADEAPTLRIWVIGYEDGSQVFLLGALIEDAIDRMRDRLEQSAERLTQRRLNNLRIEIVATDLGLRLNREGRVFRLAGFEPGQSAGPPRQGSDEAPVHQVSNLTISELGPLAAQKAREDVAKLEDEIPDLRRIPAAKVDELADAGKIGILMERLFRPGLAVRYDSGPRFEYHLHSTRWRIDDAEGLLNDGADWSMTFSLADVTKAEPPKNVDLVVVTNVLPWLKLYAQALDEQVVEQPFRRALERIRQSLRPGGWILVDPRTEMSLDAAWTDSLSRGANAGRVIVTTAAGVQPVSPQHMTADMTAESIPSPSPGAEPVFLSFRCVPTGDRSDLMAARLECDDAAATARFRYGFLQPCDPDDADILLEGSCETCASTVETPWMCFGDSPLPE